MGLSERTMKKSPNHDASLDGFVEGCVKVVIVAGKGQLGSKKYREPWESYSWEAEEGRAEVMIRKLSKGLSHRTGVREMGESRKTFWPGKFYKSPSQSCAGALEVMKRVNVFVYIQIQELRPCPAPFEHPSCMCTSWAQAITIRVPVQVSFG